MHKPTFYSLFFLKRISIPKGIKHLLRIHYLLSAVITPLFFYHFNTLKYLLNHASYLCHISYQIINKYPVQQSLVIVWTGVLGKNNSSCAHSGSYSSPSHLGMGPQFTCVCETEHNITNTTTADTNFLWGLIRNSQQKSSSG